jgi:hypothetical protein
MASTRQRTTEEHSMRRTIGMAATLGLVACGLAATAAPAQAAIGTCSGHRASTYFGAYCQGSAPSTFAAVVYCTDRTGNTYWRFGPRRNAGDGVWSYAYCDVESVRTSDEIATYP